MEYFNSNINSRVMPNKKDVLKIKEGGNTCAEKITFIRRKDFVQEFQGRTSTNTDKF